MVFDLVFNGTLMKLIKFSALNLMFYYWKFPLHETLVENHCHGIGDHNVKTVLPGWSLRKHVFHRTNRLTKWNCFTYKYLNRLAYCYKWNYCLTVCKIKTSWSKGFMQKKQKKTLLCVIFWWFYWQCIVIVRLDWLF